MAKYSKAAQRTVHRVLREFKQGTLKNGKANKVVASRKQAIAIGLSEARSKGQKAPLVKQ